MINVSLGVGLVLSCIALSLSACDDRAPYVEAQGRTSSKINGGRATVGTDPAVGLIAGVGEGGG